MMIRQDLATAIRMLRRNPGFAIAALATLAIGIGANTAIFTLVNAVLIEPLPYPQPDRMVQLWTATPGGGGLIFSIPQISLLAQQTAALQDFAAYDFGGPGVNITGEGEPEQVKAIHVSANYFRLFGAPIAAGRTFSADEDRPNGGRVVVLSHTLWTRRFHADRAVIGKMISLGGDSYLVTGVVDADFRPDPPADIWLPLQADLSSTSHASYLRSAARLRDGVSIEQANELLKLTTAELHRRYPRMNPGLRFAAKPLRETNAGGVRITLLVLFGTVIFVLLVACSNVSSLLLARAVSRQREIAIRGAMGASRARLIAQLLTESVLLSIAGGILGFILGRASLQALLALDAEAIPVAPSLDWRVWTFAAAVSLGATLLFGLLPALRAPRVDLARAMQEAGARTGVSRGTARARSALVVIQVALSVVLVIGAGLMIRTFIALRQVEPGIEPDHVLTMEMSLQGSRFPDTAAVTRLRARASSG